MISLNISAWLRKEAALTPRRAGEGPGRMPSFCGRDSPFRLKGRLSHGRKGAARNAGLWPSPPGERKAAAAHKKSLSPTAAVMKGFIGPGKEGEAVASPKR